MCVVNSVYTLSNFTRFIALGHVLIFKFLNVHVCIIFQLKKCQFQRKSYVYVLMAICLHTGNVATTIQIGERAYKLTNGYRADVGPISSC